MKGAGVRPVGPLFGAIQNRSRDVAAWPPAGQGRGLRMIIDLEAGPVSDRVPRVASCAESSRIWHQSHHVSHVILIIGRVVLPLFTLMTQPDCYFPLLFSHSHHLSVSFTSPLLTSKMNLDFSVFFAEQDEHMRLSRDAFQEYLSQKSSARCRSPSQ